MIAEVILVSGATCKGVQRYYKEPGLSPGGDTCFSLQ